MPEKLGGFVVKVTRLPLGRLICNVLSSSQPWKNDFKFVFTSANTDLLFLKDLFQGKYQMYFQGNSAVDKRPVYEFKTQSKNDVVKFRFYFTTRVAILSNVFLEFNMVLYMVA